LTFPYPRTAGLLATAPANASASADTEDMLTFMVQEEKNPRDLYN